MRMSAKETDLVRACLGWLALHRVKARRMNNTGVFDPARKVFRTFHGLAGVSDILGILPQTARLADEGEEVFGVFLAVEVKRSGEALRPDSPSQWTFRRRVRPGLPPDLPQIRTHSISAIGGP